MEFPMVRNNSVLKAKQQELSEKLVALDEEIFELLSRRLNLTNELLRTRLALNKPLVDDYQERQWMEKVGSYCEDETIQIFLMRIYRQILNISVDVFCRKLVESESSSKK